MQPLVSILVPIYNVQDYIERCTRSLFAQTYNNCEFIFVNDCTKDNSVLILKEIIELYPQLSEKVQIINHDINKGLACARNTGVVAAKGDFVMHVDSDDTIEPDTVRLCVEEAEKNNADAVLFGFKHEMKSGSRNEFVKLSTNHTEYIKMLIERKTIVCMCGGMYKRGLYVDNNVWAIPDLNMGEDYSTKPRLLYNAKKIVKIDAPLYIYNHLNESSYTKVFNAERIKDIKKAIDVLCDFFMHQTDYNEYKDSLDLAALNSKVLLLKNWGASQSTKKDFGKIQNIFRDKKPDKKMTPIDRLLLGLANHGYSTLLRLIVKSGMKLKSII